MNQINKYPEYKQEPMKKTQKDWIDYFNRKNAKMISAPDIYKAAKKGTKEIIESLKDDFDKSYEITSTRIIYNKNNLMAEIIHDAESTVVTPKKYKVRIPDLSGSFKQDKVTEKYLQSLFDTKEDIHTILRTLKRFGKNRELRLWTPSQSSRKDKQVRSVGLYFFSFDWFDVYGCGWFDYDDGLSRRVIMDSASKKQCKSKRKSK